MYTNWNIGDTVSIGLKVEDFCGTTDQYIWQHSYDMERYPTPLNLTCDVPSCSFSCIDTRNREVVFYSCMNYHPITNDSKCSAVIVDKYYREIGRVLTDGEGKAIIKHGVTIQDLLDYQDAIQQIGNYNIIACINDPYATDAHTISYGEITVGQEKKIWNVLVYYITQSDIYDPNYENIINSEMSAADTLLNNYNGTRLVWSVKKVVVPSWITIRKDIDRRSNFNMDCIENTTEIICTKDYGEAQILRNIDNFYIDYDIYDVVFIAVHGSRGGAYVRGYMSPVWFSWQIFTNEGILAGQKSPGVGIVHEFLHTFGLQDRYNSTTQPRCVMSEIFTTPINLCDQAYLFKPENYKKTPIEALLYCPPPYCPESQTISRFRITPEGEIKVGRLPTEVAEQDNTLLYMGLAVVGLAAVGGMIYFLTRPTKPKT